MKIENYLKKELYELIKNDESIFEFIQDNCLDGMWYWDLEKTENEWMNPKFWETLGYNHEDMPHSPSAWQNIINQDDLKIATENFNKHLEDESHPYDQIVRYKHRNGSTVWIRCFGKAVRDKNGKAIRMLGVHNDITELKSAIEKVEEANKSKSEFLANMSHEIRTPINAIIGLGKKMLDSNINVENKNILNKILASSKMLLGVINDILDFSKLESKKLELDIHDFYIDDILEHLNSMFNNQVNEKNIDLFFKCDLNPFISLLGDPLRLSQILTNLISNAVKFTEKGFVELVIKVKNIDEKKVCLHFEINDSGMGISSEKLEFLFKPFSQGDNSISRKYGGSGLGLVISSNLLNKMGGNLEVESQEGKGSSFYFDLDFSIHSIEKKAHYEKYLNLENMTALVVDDKKNSRDSLRNILESWNMIVSEASSGRSGLDKVIDLEKNGECFDIILMDLQMPVMDGFEASKIIRESNKQIPIIALSAAVMKEDREKSYEFGMNEHLSKPIDEKKLFEILNKWIGNKENENIKFYEEINSNSIKDEEENGIDLFKYDFKEINIAKGLEYTDNDSSLYLLILNSFKGNLENEFSDLIEVIKGDDLESAKRLIHTLKGLAETIGAENLKDSSSEINLAYVKGSLIKQYMTEKLEKDLANIKNELNKLK